MVKKRPDTKIIEASILKKALADPSGGIDIEVNSGNPEELNKCRIARNLAANGLIRHIEPNRFELTEQGEDKAIEQENTGKKLVEYN